MVRRTVKILVPVLLVLGLLLFLSPQLVAIKQVQEKFVQEAGKTLGADIVTAEIRWQWAPIPHLTILGTRIIHPDFVVNMPKVRIYPQWKAFFSGDVAIGRLYFRSPHVTLKSSFWDSATSSLPRLPHAHITVDDAMLSLDSFEKDNFLIKKTSLSEISLKIRQKKDHALFSVAGKADFAKHLALKGSYFAESHSYSATLDAVKFDPTRFLKLRTDVMKLLRSEVDFSFDIIGDGIDNTQILFSGDVPDFSLQRLEKAEFFHIKDADMLLEKNGRDFTATLYGLHLLDPAVSFSGKIKRYFADDSDLAHYRLDLAAEDINLDGVRSKLLALIGDNAITKTVCNIVRGGKAKSATYTFDAPVSGFKEIKEMVINVNVDHASIHVPEVDLNLERATGPIIIKDGEIHGHHLTSWLANHYGSNGSFSLGLSEDNWLFKLDLDIDADLATLPDMLDHLIDDDGFRKELKKFSSKGRQKGHLTIGDHLRDFDVEVFVPDLSGTVLNYDRLSWPLAFKGGALHIKENTVYWKDIAAVVGPHEVHNLAGDASWGDEAPPFSITSMNAGINAEKLFSELNRYPLIRDFLRSSIRDIDGTFSIYNGHVSGPFFSPAEWKYQIDATCEKMHVSTPHLDDPLLVSKGTLRFTDNEMILSNADVTFQGSPLSVSSRLKHENFSGFSGWLALNGDLLPAQGNWLKEQDWIPDRFFPTIPNHLKNFKISFAGQDIGIYGTLQHRSIAGVPVEAVVDIAIHQGRHQRTSLHFFTDKDDAIITISGDSRLAIPEISFKGTLEKKNVAAILSNQMLLDGGLDGYFQLSFPKDQQQGVLFKGNIQAHDLQWVWGDFLRQFSITRLSLQGSGTKLTIHDLEFLFENERVHSQGDLTFSPDFVAADLSLFSPSISQNTLTHFVDDFTGFLKKINRLEEAESTLSKKIRGSIRLEADELLFAETLKEDKKESYKLTDLKGKIAFSGDDSTTLTLTDSLFCGLALDGTLDWIGDESSKHFTLTTPEGTAPRFEEFFPCAGVEKKVITGPFTVSASLNDENGILSSGKFNFKAEKGVLEKMTLLPKIFKLINFTDLYQGLFSRGFHYKLLEVYGHVENDHLILDKAVMEGEGMDVMAQGKINLRNMEANLTFFIVPFKSIDKIINIVPLVGRIIGGKKRHIMTYPVKVSGNLKEPQISVLSPLAIGKAAVDFIFDTLTFPLDLLPGSKKKEYDIDDTEE
ncbi:MAG: AsmA-like C-terminal region-containing protein [Desulfobulbaceae bacterium]|nr:AsmA-like C-terminal region-containing protein [Desulfobulbaceae bacterium]